MFAHQKLTHILIQLDKQHPIQDSFQWPMPKHDQFVIPDCNHDIYQQNIYLKQHYAAFMQNDATLAAHYWLIQQWGGIQSFKQNPKNDEKIHAFIQALEQQKPSAKLYDSLPSLSKISSFLKPAEYVIYDARVIYTLNWLIFVYDLDYDFFPQPVTRNSQLMKFEQRTLFNLFGCQRGYVAKSEAYLLFCRIIKEMVLDANTPWTQPYEVEMLLFALAPEVIVQDIEQRVQLSLRDIESV